MEFLKASAAAAAIASERLADRPGCGSPDGQIAHDDGVAIAALRICGYTQPVYNGSTLPWWHHPAFTAARQAAFRAAIFAR